MPFPTVRRGPSRLSGAVVALAASALLTGCAAGGGGGGGAPPPSAAPAAPAAPAPAAAYGTPIVAGLIETDDIKESSGLSASECQDVLWTHNDSGNEPLIYAMSTTGGHLGTWQVTGAQNVDWESVATYREADGRCALILGDIGDNDETRAEVALYRVPEPVVSADTAASDSTSPLQTEPVQTMQLRYPNGSNDAETLLVHPWTGAIYVVTKKKDGPAGVFKVTPAFGSGAAVVSEKVADVAVPAQPEGLLTGGSISPDGRRVMLCDRNGGYELVLPDGVADPDAIWREQARAVDLGDRKQGEGVSYGRDGRSLFASSEKKNSPLYLIELR